MDTDSVLFKLTLFLMFIPALSFHEAAHAWVAHKLGDDTAKDEGRLTLNPMVHIDPIGTILIPLVNLLTPGYGLIGWAKPVPVDARNFKNWRRDDILVSLAGPASNILLAALTFLFFRWFPHENSFRLMGQYFALINVALAVFNMMPLPPLDGWHLLKHIFKIPEETVARYGMWWLLLLIVMINLEPVQMVLGNITRFIYYLLANVTYY